MDSAVSSVQQLGLTDSCLKTCLALFRPLVIICVAQNSAVQGYLELYRKMIAKMSLVEHCQ